MDLRASSQLCMSENEKAHEDGWTTERKGGRRRKIERKGWLRMWQRSRRKRNNKQ